MDDKSVVPNKAGLYNPDDPSTFSDEFSQTDNKDSEESVVESKSNTPLTKEERQTTSTITADSSTQACDPDDSQPSPPN